MKLITRVLAASISAVLILLSPGLGCWEALAQTVGARAVPFEAAPLTGVVAPDAGLSAVPLSEGSLDASSLPSEGLGGELSGLPVSEQAATARAVSASSLPSSRGAAVSRTLGARPVRTAASVPARVANRLFKSEALSKNEAVSSAGLDRFYSNAASRAGDVVDAPAAASLLRPLVRSALPDFGFGPIVSTLRDGKISVRGPPAAQARLGRGQMGALAIAIGVPIAIGLVAASIALFVYDVYLFFNLFGYFGGAPFHYGFLGKAFAAFFATGAIGGVIGKTFTFFKGGSGDKEKRGVDPARALASYVKLFGTIALIGTPFILYANWGHLAASFMAGAHLFTHWKFQYLLGGLLGFSFLVHAFQKVFGVDDGMSVKDHAAQGIVATLIAPVAEEIVFRWGMFNIARWFFMGLLGFVEPVRYVLPLFHMNVGWGLPLGILLAMFGNADSFFKAHGKGKWFHHWAMGVVNCYAYYVTGSLLAPIAIHLIWNALCSAFDLVLSVVLPLKGRR
jgi:hypothetical protein